MRKTKVASPLPKPKIKNAPNKSFFEIGTLLVEVARGLTLVKHGKRKACFFIPYAWSPVSHSSIKLRPEIIVSIQKELIKNYSLKSKNKLAKLHDIR